MKKNQLILTVLAVMIAVAGYLTYAGKNADSIYTVSDNQANQNVADGLLDISDEDILSENIALEQAQALGETEATAEAAAESTAEETQQADATIVDEQALDAQVQEGNGETETGEPGDAILTNADNIANFIAQVQLNRERTRADNKETLNAIIENSTIDEEQKQDAINSLVHMTEIAQLEGEIEDLLSAKGIDNIVATIGDNSVDIVVGMTEITDVQRAQIEEVVKRKANVSASEIVISLMNEK